MRAAVGAHTWIMEPTVVDEHVPLDHSQVKKAVLALLAYLKSSPSQQQLLNESQQIGLLLTLWKIPRQEQTIRIPLPHAIRTESADFCLFTRDEPNMTADQTERFYKKLLTQIGLNYIPEVIPFKTLKTEYKTFESKRRLLGNFDVFLADARIRRRLPSHIGKHFYERKKAPLSVDLTSKHLARDLERLVQGTTLNTTKKGSCCMARIAHSDMTADEIIENVLTAVKTISSKLRATGKSIKTIHLKSPRSVALPIYTSNLGHLALLEEGRNKSRSVKARGNAVKRKTEESNLQQTKESVKDVPKDVEQKEDEKEEEEIPQLVPIESPSKKPKAEVPSKMKKKKKVPKPAAAQKVLNPKQGQKKSVKKAPTVQAQKRKKVSA